MERKGIASILRKALRLNLPECDGLNPDVSGRGCFRRPGDDFTLNGACGKLVQERTLATATNDMKSRQ